MKSMIGCGIALAVAMLLASPAIAQTQQHYDWCLGKGGSTPDQRISSCTIVILLGKYQGKNLAWAFNNRGMAYDNKGQYDRAIEDYNEAIRLNPNSASAFNNRGIVYEKKRQYDRAIEDYKKSIGLDPNDADTFYNRGGAYYRKSDYDNAIADYDRAIAGFDPTKYPASYKRDYFKDRANAYSAKGDYGRGIADYSEAIRLDPDYARAYYNRSEAKRKIGDTVGSDADLARARQLQPSIATEE